MKALSSCTLTNSFVFLTWISTGILFINGTEKFEENRSVTVVTNAIWPNASEAAVPRTRFPRRTSGHRRSEACDMLIAIDEPLYVTYDRDLKNLTKMVQLYVKQLNEIYHSKVLLNEYNDFYFRVKEIRILFDFCTECNHTQRVFLEEFTKIDTSSFCLAHIFTFRDFPAGIQGLAYKGTVCSSSHNTGFTTFLNHQVKSSASDSVMTFAHEVGHNMGAEHDEDAGCARGFIMSEAGSTKRSHMDQEFSNCSITAIHKQIKSVKNHRQRRKKTCIKHRLQKSNDLDFSICGDYKVEGAEECDCGMSYTTCSDPCCYAAHISPDDLSWNSTAVPCRTHRSPICINPFRSALTFGVIVPWTFIGLTVLALLISLCYDWRSQKKCFKKGPVIEVNIPRSKSEPRSVTSSSNHQQQYTIPAKSPLKKETTQNHLTNNHNTTSPIIKPKAPPPPPPLGVAPYLPPLRSQSQPPPMVRFTSLEFSSPPKPIYYKPVNQTCWYQRPSEQVQINHQFNQVNHQINPQVNQMNRPTDPPPPIPPVNDYQLPKRSEDYQLPKSPPPKVPYATRPQLSEVAYLKKNFEDNS